MLSCEDFAFCARQNYTICITKLCYYGVLASLNTTASFRSKCSSVVPKPEEDRLAKAKSNKNNSANVIGTKESQKGRRGKIAIMILGTQLSFSEGA